MTDRIAELHHDAQCETRTVIGVSRCFCRERQLKARIAELEREVAELRKALRGVTVEYWSELPLSVQADALQLARALAAEPQREQR